MACKKKYPKQVVSGKIDDPLILKEDLYGWIFFY